MEDYSSSSSFTFMGLGIYSPFPYLIKLLVFILVIVCINHPLRVKAASLGGEYLGDVSDQWDAPLSETENTTDNQYDVPETEAIPDVSSGDYAVHYISDSEIEYSDFDEFAASPVYVTRYEYELLNRLEFIQYALVIVIALLFLLFFRKK